MGNNNTIYNFSLFEEQINIDSEHFYRNLKNNSKENSKSQNDDNITIELNESDFMYNKVYTNQENLKENSISDNISVIKKESREESFTINSSIKFLNNKYWLLSNLEKLKDLVNNIRKIYFETIKKPIIKCFLGENNNDCNYIPIIKKKRFSISFYCDNHEKETYKEIDSIFYLKNVDKLFMPGPRVIMPQIKDKNEKINNINLLKNMTKFDLSIISWLKRKIHKIIKYTRNYLKKKIDEYKGYLNNYYNTNKNSKILRDQSLIRITIIYYSFLEKINLLIYFIIIQRLIYEYDESSIKNIKNKYTLFINFLSTL